VSRWLALSLTLLLAAACGPAEQPGTARPTPIQLRPTPTAHAGASPTVPLGTPGQQPTSATPSTPSPPPAPFEPEAVTLQFEPFAAGLGPLTYLTHAADGSGRLYAVQRPGLIDVIERDGSIHPQPFLDISDRVTAGRERGLLGLAFHPAYSANGRFFVNYIDDQGNTVVSEFARSGEATADAASERIVLYLEQPFGNHNGGMLDFGADGRLYVSSGDGGGSGDPLGAGQDLATLLGAILRIDVDAGEPYAIPADNPFVGQQAAQAEIWAWGLRNPWRFSFDRRDGTLFIADVGQNRWEEINVERPADGGHNYGWNIMEGPECFAAEDCDTSGLTPPVAWYSPEGRDCAIIGGYVYRGEQYPALQGAYLLADHCSGTVRALDAEAAKAGGLVSLHELGNAGLRVTSFGEDEAGELYLLGLGGEVLRITARSR
jgi:glucose/arabinose dehydrogenase